MFIFVIDNTYNMAYLDVITLAEAKTYLRIDDTLTEDDNRITSMIKASLSMLERKTNVLVYARDKEYTINETCLRVYDYPINTVVTTDLERDIKPLYSIFTKSSDIDTITLNVGYLLPEDVPSDLIECALVYIDYLYYSRENNGSNKIPDYIESMIHQLKRFIL